MAMLCVCSIISHPIYNYFLYLWFVLTAMGYVTHVKKMGVTDTPLSNLFTYSILNKTSFIIMGSGQI